MVAQGIYKDRGSKFIAFAEPITDEEQAKARIAWYKKKYHDARHVCYAYLDNILVVVVRYFGGTLLGTGGLMVAYREASKDALDKYIDLKIESC